MCYTAFAVKYPCAGCYTATRCTTTALYAYLLRAHNDDGGDAYPPFDFH
jgi:hypothetical protein